MTKPKPKAKPDVSPLADQPTANAERGEDMIMLEGEPYRLRPSFEANVAIEKLTGHSLIELYNQGSRGALPLEYLGIIVTQWIKAGAETDDARNVGAKRVAELIYTGPGQVETTLGVTTMLNEAITGGRDSLGEKTTVNA